MLKGFKDFIMRGNIVDLAVAFVVGAAFAKTVDAFVSGIVSPILNRVGGRNVGAGLGIQLGDAGNAKTFLDLGAIVNAIVVFLVTAAVVYFIFVVPMNKINELRNAGKSAEVSEDEISILKDIRTQLSTRPNA